jgi:hypothetical protein
VETDLKRRLKTLSEKVWDHPIKGPRTKIAFSTLENWYYQAKKNPNNLATVLANNIRWDLGSHRALSMPLKEDILNQYQIYHPRNIRNFIKRGMLKAVKANNKWYVDLKSVEALLTQPKAPEGNGTDRGSRYSMKP